MLRRPATICIGALVFLLGVALPASAGPISRSSTTTIVPYLAAGYRYQDVNHGGDAGFENPAFDDSNWPVGPAAFGIGTCPIASTVRTRWRRGTDMLLRRTVPLPPGASDVKVSFAIDNDVVAYWNGTRIGGGTYEGCAARDSFTFVVPSTVLLTGDNLLAVRGTDRGGDSYLDLTVVATLPGGAALSVSPAAGPPGTKLTITGTGFGPDETIALYFDMKILAPTVTDSAGDFTVTRRAPARDTPGDHWVTAVQYADGVVWAQQLFEGPSG